MDVLLETLDKFAFTRVSSSLNKPIVVHSVPGAGKSSVIREIIKRDSRFSAITFGKADEPNLEGSYIKKASTESSQFLLVDEYTEGPIPEQAYALFADPLQSESEPLRAHFIKRESHRFGKCTAALLQDLGWQVTARGEDIVQIADIYTLDPKEQVIFYEKEVGDLLRAHGVPASCISEVRGATFEHVTFVTGENSPKDRAAAFQCLTRHSKSLLILCPDATYTAS
uniref:TGB1 n=1 Tax=Potato virus S TaxID=12169 RepID=A0A2P1E975_9VIRU|nr:TGB1 [Potato virus S]